MRHVLPFIFALACALPAVAQGPLVLMGIDAEDAGVGGHGPISVYESVLTNVNGTGILDNVTNGGSGILVIGGGKNPLDDVTEFWDQIGTDLGETITYVNGAAAITNVLFGGFAVLAVVSDGPNTPSGGLTNAENTALTGRGNDIATHVTGGGGLLGFSQCDLSNPYGYLLGAIVCTSSDHDDITPTPEGLLIGITNALDICCWHDNYTTFPAFLEVLATDNALFGGAGTNEASAIGGLDVIPPGQIEFTPGSLPGFNEPGTDHTVTVTVVDANNNPIVGVDVDFTVISGPNAGESDTVATNGAGEASFTYTSDGTPGMDTIEACFDDPNDQPDKGDICTIINARKFWDLDCNENGVPDTCDIDCGGFGGECDTDFDGDGANDCGGSNDDDGNGVPDECNMPPDCSGAVASVDELWPPNHTFRSVSVEGVTDPDGDPITITITAIAQDESVNGVGDGNTCPDGTGVGDSSAEVRAERSGLLDGRVYHISFLAEDGQGGECEGSVTVCVPHDQHPGHVCGDQGPLFDSTDCGGMAGVSLVPPLPCPADLDGEGSVGTADLLILLAQWGLNPGWPPDFDGDGTVGTSDLLILLGSWGPCP